MATIKYLNDNGDYEEVSTIKIVEEGGGSQMEYWSFPNGLPDDSSTKMVAALATLVKCTAFENTVILPTGLTALFGVEYKSFVGMAFNKDLKTYSNDCFVILGDIMSEIGAALTTMGGVQITEEEFYTV